jgi:hypothetical protein
MSLRIRRGTDAQRQSLTFDQGEVVYTTDTKKLYIGDGITAGGTNILSTSAGAGVTFNPTTQLFDFNTAALGITTSDVAEGSRKYFTSQRAQDAAAALFTATGSPTSSGSITGTIATGTIVLTSADSALVNGSRIVIAGAGGNGISAGTYYVVSAVGTSVVLANSLVNATNGVQITGVNTGSVTGTTYTAGGTDSGITFTYDSVNHVINVVSTGSTSLINDTNPRLGANLNILNFNITSAGSGAISIVGNISTSAGSLTAGPIVLNNGVITSTKASPTGGAVRTDTYNLTLGTNATPSTLWIESSSNFLVMTGLSDGTNHAGISSRISRGTKSAPTIVQAGDALAFIEGQGHDGTTYRNRGAFGLFADPDWIGSIGVNRSVPAAFGAIVIDEFDTQRTMSFSGKGVLTAPVIQAASYATTAYPAGGPISLLTGVTITGVAGQFQCASTTLKVGGIVTITGTLAGATISGYASPTNYYIVATNGTTTFTLSTTNGGGGVTTSGTTPTGITYSLSLPQKGMIIFDSTTNRFMGYNGTNWVAFTGP